MTYTDFKNYIEYFNFENILPLVIKLLAQTIDIPFSYDKLKLYVNECKCGKVVKEYYIHNGKDKITIDSIKKLWQFINED